MLNSELINACFFLQLSFNSFVCQSITNLSVQSLETSGGIVYYNIIIMIHWTFKVEGSCTYRGTLYPRVGIPLYTAEPTISSLWCHHDVIIKVWECHRNTNTCTTHLYLACWSSTTSCFELVLFLLFLTTSFFISSLNQEAGTPVIWHSLSREDLAKCSALRAIGWVDW